MEVCLDNLIIYSLKREAGRLAKSKHILGGDAEASLKRRERGGTNRYLDEQSDHTDHVKICPCNMHNFC